MAVVADCRRRGSHGVLGLALRRRLTVPRAPLDGVERRVIALKRLSVRVVFRQTKEEAGCVSRSGCPSAVVESR